MDNLKENINAVLLEDEEIANVSGGANFGGFGLPDNFVGGFNNRQESKENVRIGSKSSSTFDLF